MPDITDIFQRADDAGLRLEIIKGLPVWEAPYSLIHQETIDRIRQSFSSEQDGGCHHYANLHITFPDGSEKRSDISIFCEEPSETEFAVTEVPEAVIEIISRGYEKKDLELGPPFYLGQGVKDVIVFNPYTNDVHHFDADGNHEYQSPITLRLKCGCQVEV